jgi:general secretion pathway protein D
MLDLKRLAIIITVGATLLTPADARTRKGEKFLQEGRKAESAKQWEAALDSYEKALLEDPSDPAYMMATQRVRFQASMVRVDTGQKLRKEGKLEEALNEFQRAYAIDPSSSIAEEELKRTREMIEREKAPGSRSATPEERGLTPAEQAQKTAEEKASRIMAVPELKPVTRQLNTLKMNNQPVRVLYETVGKLAGINVIFDAEYQNPPGKTNFTVDLSNTTLEEALDYLAIQTKSYWKPLSANAIFVTNDNVTKRRDYEDYVVKVFYIKNATSIQELQEISTTIRSVTEIRRAFTYNAQYAILVRGTADQVALAEKLVQDLDKPKAEVVIDVLVMEANRSRVRNLAATFTTGNSAGIDVPIVYNKSSTSTDDEGTETTTGNMVALNQIKSLGSGDFSVAVPGGLLQALMTDTNTRVLQQPQVRAVEMQKASLKIGDRIPYATGSFQPGVGSVGLNPLVSTQFNFLDTGVNVDITPKMHGKDEVSLHIEVDVSSKSGEVNLGGLRQPIVSRRTVIHDIRIRDGEINMLGGLLGTQETIARTGVPLLMDIPILGRLFSTETLDRARGELMIVLIPHIVRAPDYSETNLRAVSAGNDQNVKLSIAPRPMPPAGTGAPATPEAPAVTEPAAPPAEAPKEPAPEAPAQPAAGPSLSFNPASVQTELGSAITVPLQVENVQELFTAPLRLKFDPKVLRLTSITPGTLMTADGQKVNFSENTLNDTGEATITLNRIPGTGGVSGSGSLVTLIFQAVGKGTSTVSVVDAGLRNMQLAPITVPPPTLSVVVQ